MHFKVFSTTFGVSIHNLIMGIHSASNKVIRAQLEA